MRHPGVGSAQQASNYASVPIINAGDGTGEHPTQVIFFLFSRFHFSFSFFFSNNK